MALFRTSMASAYRREGDTLLIELKLRDTRQLFNSLDPAPFIEKDLDDDAENYIIDAVREVRTHRPKKLIVYLPPGLVATEDAQSIPQACMRTSRIARSTPGCSYITRCVKGSSRWPSGSRSSRCVWYCANR